MASIGLLDRMGIPNPERRVGAYPFELSGGMRQRVMIAMSLLCRPEVLIADEPTTALDVTVQAQIMALLSELQKEFGMATILITHDLGVIAGFCRNVIVLYGGQVMEKAPVDPLFASPSHPYTRGLISAIPRVDTHGEVLVTIPGAPPNMMRDPKGCPFAPRCGYASDDCLDHLAPLSEFAPDRFRACNRSLEELA